MRLIAATIVTLFLSVVLFGSGARKAEKPKVTMEQAKATALAKRQGSIKSGELEKEHGKLVYSFDIETAEGLREVQVDALTGKVVEDKAESAADEAKEAAQDKKEQRKDHSKKPIEQSK